MRFSQSAEKVLDAQSALGLLPKAFTSGRMQQETFYLLCLNAQNQRVGRAVLVAKGTVNSVVVHPRDVFRPAVVRNASAVLVAHNHPSGDCSPSDDDRRLTWRLQEAGDLLGIPVLDHLIVGLGGNYLSLKEKGVM